MIVRNCATKYVNWYGLIALILCISTSVQAIEYLQISVNFFLVLIMSTGKVIKFQTSKMWSNSDGLYNISPFLSDWVKYTHT